MKAHMVGLVVGASVLFVITTLLLIHWKPIQDDKEQEIFYMGMKSIINMESKLAQLQHELHNMTLQLEQIERQSNDNTPTRRVFFDLGANYGDSALQFAGLTKEGLGGAPAAEYLHTLAETHKGPWDIRMYEAHPKFDQSLIDVANRLRAVNDRGPFNVFLFNSTAIGWMEGTITFYLDTKSAQTWGSSILDDHPDVTANKSSITVPIHDLIKEIRKYKISDYVVIKMDIEGVEGELLSEMLIRGVFPWIDELHAEYHQVPSVIEKDKAVRLILESTGKKYLTIGNWE